MVNVILNNFCSQCYTMLWKIKLYIKTYVREPQYLQETVEISARGGGGEGGVT